MWYLIPLGLIGAYALYKALADQPGQVTLSQGSGMKITKALAVYDANNHRFNLPAGTTITADRFDSQGTLYTTINGVQYHSPIEEYSDKVA
jgi:hypothetical protein